MNNKVHNNEHDGQENELDDETDADKNAAASECQKKAQMVKLGNNRRKKCFFL